MTDKSLKNKAVIKRDLSDYNETHDNLAYWLSRTPQERLEAVDILRRQRDGNPGRLKRVYKIIKLK